MGREIKFRAVIGIEDGIEIRQDIQSIDFDNDGHIIFISDVMYCVGEDTILEQYTGMKDAEGKEIYEGDILRSDLDTIDVVDIVFWDEENACFATKPNYIDWETMPDPSMKIIGNIHENPELLNN